MYQLSEASRQQTGNGAIHGGTVAGSPMREPEVGRRIQALDRQTAMAGDAVRELVERLGAVSRPAQPVAENSATKEANEVCHTDVGNILMGMERRLVMLQRTAEDALNRLEV